MLTKEELLPHMFVAKGDNSISPENIRYLTVYLCFPGNL